MVTEFVDGGELFTEIRKLCGLSEQLAANIMRQLLSAIEYCHKRGIVHRDLKPENILIEKTDNKNELNIKVIDFGTATAFEPNSVLRKAIGTICYMAPEVFNMNYNEKCDIWSCGIILYILLSGHPPFEADNDEEVIDAIKEGKFDYQRYAWTQISDDAKDLINHMLVLQVKNRYSAQEAYSHKWIQNDLTKPLDPKIMKDVIEGLTNFHVITR